MENKEINEINEIQEEIKSLTDEQKVELMRSLTVKGYDSLKFIWASVDDKESREFYKTDFEALKRMILEYSNARELARRKADHITRVLAMGNEEHLVPYQIIHNELRLACEALHIIASEQSSKYFAKQHAMFKKAMEESIEETEETENNNKEE